MNLQSIFGGISIGKDSTGNFLPSFKGLAVRASADGKFVVREGKNLLDVTDLTIEGAEQYVYRLPVRSVKPGDLILTSENPFAALFVQEVDRATGRLIGLDPYGVEVKYFPPTNLFKARFFVRVVSLLDSLAGPVGGDNLLPLFLLGNKSSGGGTDECLTTIFLLHALGETSFKDDKLLSLLLLKGSGDALETLLLLQAQKGGSNPFGGLFNHGSQVQARPRRALRSKQRK